MICGTAKEVDDDVELIHAAMMPAGIDDGR